MRRIEVKEFDEMYTIMKEAFPKEERRTYEEQKALFMRDDYQVYGIWKDGKLQSFITLYDVKDFYFVEHLATLSSARGSGVGKELLMQCFTAIKKDIIFEVELPKTSIAQRRIGFYERLGCHLYPGIPYVQPPFYKVNKPLPLYLMSWPNYLQEDVLKACVKAIYQKVYRVKK